MLTEDEVSDDESNRVEIPSQTEIKAPEIVDLDEWIVAVGKANQEDQTAFESGRQLEVAQPEAVTEEEPPFTLTQEAAVSWTQFRQSEQRQLAFSFG